jgi:glycosyltransferase involved in cell wall biosynthesis
MTKGQRIALIIGSLGTGGVERQTLVLARGLVARGLDVEVIALKREGPLAAEAAKQGLRVWSADARNGVDLAGLRRLRRHLRESAFDAVLAANQYASIVLRAATLMGARPSRVFSAFHTSPALLGASRADRLRLGLYRLALRGCDGLVYVSRRQRDEWQALHLAPRLPAVVIHNGLDTARFSIPPVRDLRAEMGWPPEAFVVGLCAALRPEKQALDLVRAVALLAQQGVPVRLLIIGDGPERPAIERALVDAGLFSHAVITGLQSDVVPFIQACDVMTLVSRTESFSMAVLEAMACGKPVVLTDVGGAAEQVEQGVHGYRVPVGQPAQIAEALQRLWSEGSAARVGALARERVEREFSLERMVDRYARLLSGAPWSEMQEAPVAAAAPVASGRQLG